MIYLFFKHRIVDYARWREEFDCHLSARQAGGATAECLVFRDMDNPQEVIVILGWRDLVQARLFIKSISWQMAVQQMGVVHGLQVRFLEGMA